MNQKMINFNISLKIAFRADDLRYVFGYTKSLQLLKGYNRGHGDAFRKNKTVWI